MDDGLILLQWLGFMNNFEQIIFIMVTLFNFIVFPATFIKSQKRKRQIKDPEENSGHSCISIYCLNILNAQSVMVGISSVVLIVAVVYSQYHYASVD